MSDELPEWVTEGAEVWLRRSRGAWRSDADPEPATVVRFTPQRVIVADRRGNEHHFTKSNLRGVGRDGDYDLISPDDPRVVTGLRNQAVAAGMSELRNVITDLLLGSRLNWNELPDARDAAERIHEASGDAVMAIARAAERYGDGLRRGERA